LAFYFIFYLEKPITMRYLCSRFDREMEGFEGNAAVPFWVKNEGVESDFKKT
jgi:hypothetical protein